MWIRYFPSFLLVSLNALRWQWTALLSFLHLQISVRCVPARRERSYRRQCGGWSPLQTQRPRKNTKLWPGARFSSTRTSKGPDSLDRDVGPDSLVRKVGNTAVCQQTWWLSGTFFLWPWSQFNDQRPATVEGLSRALYFHIYMRRCWTSPHQSSRLSS